MIIFPDKHSKAKKSKSVKKQKFHHDEKQLRCNECENCRAIDCGECINCKEMFKFGGKIDPSYQDKDNCVQRQCTNLHKVDHDDEKQLRGYECENCMAKDCGGGIFCKEMFKFGGKIDQDEKKFENLGEETCAYCNRYVWKQ